MSAESYTLSMRLFKRSDTGFYFAEVSRGVRRSLKTTDLAEARLRFKKLKKVLLKEKVTVLDGRPDLTLSSFLEQYLSWAEVNLAFQSVKRIKRILPQFREAVGASKSVYSLDFSDMDAYVAYLRSLGNSPETINIGIRHIKAVFGWGAHLGRRVIPSSPFVGYKLIKYQKAAPRFLSITEIDRVFEAIGNRRRDRLAFALYVYTGMRRGEVHRLEWRDISQGMVRVRQAKGYRPREVPISDRLQSILDESPSGVGLVIGGNIDEVGKLIMDCLRSAGLGKFRPHDLRHTFASHLILAGVPLATVSRLMGHASILSTMIYSHLDKSSAVEAIRNLPY